MCDMTDNQGIGTILNDTDTATITIDDVTQSEDGGNATFTVSLDNPVSTDITLTYTTADGTATDADNDYEPATGTVTFTAGTTADQTFDVTVNSDPKVEPDENYFVNLTGSVPANVDMTDNQGIGTILNDTDTATITIDDVTQSEDGGNATFTVSLDNPVSTDITLTYTTADGTATDADNDYEPATGTVTFTAGTTADQTFDVTVNSDPKVEPDENYFVNLTGSVPANVDMTDNQGIGTILNDTDTATITIDDVTQSEDGGNATFTVSLDNPVSTDITLTYTTADGTATDADNDYEPATGTVTFTAGTTADQTFDVTVNSDPKVEPDENYFVNLTGSVPANVDMTDDQGIGTILNDTDTATITIDDVTQSEDGGNATFTVSLDNPVSTDITLTYTTADGTATDADNDYEPATGTVTFTAGTTADQTFDVTVNSDPKVEPDENYFVKLTGSVPANVDMTDDQGIGTILNDTDTATITIDDVTQSEDGGNATFTVSLDNPVSTDITLTYTTADGTATDADNDYEPATGTVTFTAGTTADQTFDVTVNSDPKVEPDENYFVNLTGSVPANVDMTDNQGIGTILNDTDSTTISIAGPATLNESQTGTYTISLTNPVQGNVDVDITANDGTATFDLDTSSSLTAGVPSTVTINDGSQTHTFDITAVLDAYIEPDEDYSVGIGNIIPSSPVTVDSGNMSVTTTIGNGSVVGVSLNGPNATSESHLGNVTLNFTVDLDPGDYVLGTESAVVHYQTDTTGTGPGHAEADVDFLAVSNGTLTFPGNGSSVPDGSSVTLLTFPITIYNNDDVIEDPETFIVRIWAGPGADTTNNTTEIEVTITDNDVTIHPVYNNGGTIEIESSGEGADYIADIGSTVHIDLTWAHGLQSYNDPTGSAGAPTNSGGTGLNPAISGGSAGYDMTVTGTPGDRIDLNATFRHAINFTIDPVGATDITPIGGNDITGTNILVVDDLADPRFAFKDGDDTDADVYCVSDVTVDGGPVGAPLFYEFTDVDDDHTLVVNFRSNRIFVTIDPIEVGDPGLPVNERGQWRLLNSSDVPVVNPGAPASGWYDSGASITTQCQVNDYKIQFKEVAGWIAPDPINLTINDTTPGAQTYSGTYQIRQFVLTIDQTHLDGGPDGTITLSPVGESGPNAGEYIYYTGDTVELAASPAAGSIFNSSAGGFEQLRSQYFDRHGWG